MFTIGCVGIAGFAMLLVFFRALAVTDAITPGTIDRVSDETGLAAVLFGWIGAFYLGELLLAIALLMAGTTREVDPGRRCSSTWRCSPCPRCCRRGSSR